MQWLRRSIRKWITTDPNLEKIVPVRGIWNCDIDGDPMRFQIFRANGGTVVQTTVYDRVKDRSYHKLHIITDDKDLGIEIGKIITMEALRG
jgi:hypothetical protein